MSYQVIARKWRPQTFEEVTGQEHITRTLRGAIEHERLHHAYLFSGARGVGKTTTARLLAKAVNCHRAERPTPTPCSFNDPDACPSCREVAEGRSIDVLEIDAASNTGVDNVRDAIINTVGVRPARDRYKVFIIDEVHMLSPSAFNALLKTLEEPPPRVLFIMATTEAHKVPDTILSRCQQFEFRTISTAKIAERLKLIAKEEKIKVSDDALREVARAGEGSMRDAQSAFDQVISFSEGKIEVRDVETALGLAGVELRARVMRAVADAAPADALAVVDDLVSRGHDLRNFCRDLLAHVRDLLVLKAAGEASEFADAGADERRALAELAGEFSESDLVRFFHSLTETERHLRESAHPRYQLEIGLVKLVEMRRLAPLGQIVERLNALEEALRGAGASASASGGSTPSGTPSGAGGETRRGGAVKSRGGASASAAFASNENDGAPRQDAPDERAEVITPPARVATPPRSDGAAALPTREADAAAPLDLSQMRAAGLASHDAPPQPAASFAGLKLVPPAEADGVSAPPFEDDEPPFPVEGAVRARPAHVAPPPPSSFDASPVFASRGASDGGASSSRQPAGAAFAPTRAEQDVPRVDSGGADADPLGLVKRALEARRKPFLAVAIEEARTARIDSDELFVAFTPDKKYLRDTLAKPENVRLLQEVCREMLGRDVGVRVVIREAEEGDELPQTKEEEERRERQRLRELAERQPAVQEVLRAFRAEIVDVRRMDGEAQ